MYDEVTVGQLCNLYIENGAKVQIWSCDKEATVLEGTYYEAMCSNYADSVVCSFGIESGLICINI